MENKKKKLIIGVIVGVLVLTLATTFALWAYSKIGQNQLLISGDVYMKYTGTNNINVVNATPSDTYNKTNYFEFTVEGKNTYSKDIIYDIVLDHGKEPTGDGNENRNVRIEDKFLKFRLVKVTGEDTEEELIQEGNYENIVQKRIWIERIAANTKEETSTKYRLYVWISNDIKIGLGDDIDYEMDTWNNNVYASIKVTVNGDFAEKGLEDEPEPVETIATELLKTKIGTGGLVGVTNNNEKVETADGGEIREYRYSGPTANNYVKFNDELWRIIGIFKDDSGQEHLKIVRNELIKQADFPTTYEAEGTSFKIRYTGSGGYAYWNSTQTGTNSNDWTTAGLMYWLNSKGTDSSDTGYLNKISSTYKDMIYEAKWNLGNIVYNTDTPVTAYGHERGSKTCSGSCSGGDIRSGNEATWTGKIGLMYPSDMGFSTDSSYWTSNMYNWSSSQLNTTWLNEGHTTYEWLLSPSSHSANNVAGWDGAGDVITGSAINGYGARPTLYLKSSVSIMKGTGEQNTPYELNYVVPTAADTIKETMGQTGGIIGVTTSNTKVTQESSSIREYRYSGLGAKNYVKFNDELWRIIGIFKDDAGQEHLKIVRNEVLPVNAMPDTYTVSGTSYKIRYSSSSATAYWNYIGSAYNNNWVKGGLKYWLNSEGTTDGYLKTLSTTAQGMIEETKYYLGTLTYDSTNDMKDTVAEAYTYERAVGGCSDNKGPSANSSGSALTGNSTCRVWANNAATWTGKIGLMYPSDYGYTVDSQYWTNTMISSKGFTSTVVGTSWLFKEANHSSAEWFLSPSSVSTYGVAYWLSAGNVLGNSELSSRGVRPTLYLKSSVSITKGTGEQSTPYELL